MASIAVGGVAVLLLVRRWRRGAPEAPPNDASAATARDGEDERLDAELAELDS
jgi:hypothetical protein